MLDELCPVCGHVIDWSVGKLRRRWFGRGVHKWSNRVKYWYCSVGEGQGWTVPFCGCLHPAHNLGRG